MIKILQKILILWIIFFTHSTYADDLISLLKSSQSPQEFIPNPPSVKASSYIILDAANGTIIAHKNMHQQRAPASLTKMLSLYIISEHLANGEINLEDTVKVSTNAWKTAGSRMFIKEGQNVTVQDLITGIIVQSGNDACIALVEHIAGDINAFVSIMNQKAQHLGMHHSYFVDPTGLPNPEQKSTAHDMAILTNALINDFPQYYHWYKEKWFTFNGIKQPNRNRLLWRIDYVDGVKTGFTSDGFVQASSGYKNGSRFIVVTFGSPTEEARAQDGKILFNYAYRFFKSQLLYSKNQEIGTNRIWYGKKNTISLGLKDDYYVTIPNNKTDQLSAKIVIDRYISAPINKGQKIGKLVVKLQDNVLQETDLIALEDIPKANIFGRSIDYVKIFFNKVFSKSS